ncbi:MAG: DNA-protecting protein DprA [Alphaproteobacteria bacterium]|jgi:DNA processing protein|nr:DNA-protecting protein DprA [Alphaproteobacteria bacterium]
MDDTTTLNDIERLARLRLIRASNIGAVTFWALLERYGDATTAVAALPDLTRRSRSTRPLKLPTEQEAAAEFERAAVAGARILAHGEPDYPRALVDLDVPPPIVTVRGNPKLFALDTIAIVGARNASALGQRFARDIAYDLGAAGIVIVSGLARGIDTAAHKGSLATGTIAVMAGGIDVVYPPENQVLYEEIAAKGAVISEIQMGQQPTAHHFPRRNRIISGLARGVVVVEATLNSGSLITARIAGEQGRDVFAVPGSPLDPRAKGTNGLLRQGAILTESAEDVLNALGPREPTPKPKPKSDPKARAILQNTDALQREILKRLGPAPVEIDELVRLLGASPAGVSAALLDLEFAGQITRHPGQKISASGGC